MCFLPQRAQRSQREAFGAADEEHQPGKHRAENSCLVFPIRGVRPPSGDGSYARQSVDVATEIYLPRDAK